MSQQSTAHRENNLRTFLLRLEGVNLANFIDDTQDLSTIRGGSLMLLEAVKHVGKSIAFLKPISTGASSGLFEFQADDDKAEAICKEVSSLLAKEPYCHATFVVDIEPYTEATFVIAREVVLAKNRWRQMQMPSLSVPRRTKDNSAFPCCEEDAIRPKDTGKRLSVSVAARQEFGRDQKRSEFYKTQLLLSDSDNDAKFLDGFTFASHFGEIADNPERGNLHNKLAVFYVDGNAFGKIQSECESEGELTGFDTTIKDYRRAFLKNLLTKATISAGDSAWCLKTGEEQKLRIETLLWGGDEFMFVVPAWQGFWLLDFFFNQSKDWEYTKKDWEYTKDETATPLHHAAGLVFCHHNAPIHRIKQLAKDLAELVKNGLKDKTQESGFAYIALESFDSVGLDLDSYLEKTLLENCASPLNKASAWVVPASAASVWMEHIPVLTAQLPKRRVYREALRVAKGEKLVPVDLKQGLSPEATTSLTELCNSLNMAKGDGLAPLHLALLWDYMACYGTSSKSVVTPAREPA